MTPAQRDARILELLGRGLTVEETALKARCTTKTVRRVRNAAAQQLPASVNPRRGKDHHAAAKLMMEMA